MSPVRLDVPALDGTPIAVWVEGTGPALAMVHGMVSDHTTFGPFVGVLGRHFTTYALDRRGRGATPDGGDGYTIETDFADVATVVDAVAKRTSGPVVLWGHSYGAGCAMGAATLTESVSHLVVYEPGLGGRYPDGSIERIETALARADNDTAIETFLFEVLELSGVEVDAIRDNPLWPTRIAAAPTVPRECRAEREWVYKPGQFDTITVPTLVLQGSDSSPDLIEATQKAFAAIPGAELRTLDGHGHFAHRTDPAMVTTIIKEFISAATR